MAQPPIGAEVHQPLDVDRNLAAKVAFDHIVSIDRFANLHHFRVGQLGDPPLGGDMHLLDDLFGLLRPDPVDVLERDDHALVGGDIDACYASHSPKRSISAAVRQISRAPRDCPSRRPGEAGPCRESTKTQKIPRAQKTAPGPSTASGWRGCNALPALVKRNCHCQAKNERHGLRSGSRPRPSLAASRSAPKVTDRRPPRRPRPAASSRFLSRKTAPFPRNVAQFPL